MAKSLQALVTERLAELGRNPTEAARRGGLERTFLVDILKGRKRTVRGDNVGKLASALDWTPDHIVGTGRALPQPESELTRDDFERLKLACAFFVEAFSDTEGALQWIEALQEVVQTRKTAARPLDQETIRAKAEAIADLAKAGLRQKNR